MAQFASIHGTREITSTGFVCPSCSKIPLQVYRFGLQTVDNYRGNIEMNARVWRYLNPACTTSG